MLIDVGMIGKLVVISEIVCFVCIHLRQEIILCFFLSFSLSFFFTNILVLGEMRGKIKNK